MSTVKDAHKKVITTTTAPEVIGDSQPFLKKSDFNKAIFAQGYNSLIERALPCPCVDSATGNALPNCMNCGGTKWVFIDKTATKLLLQSMNTRTKFQNWSEEDRGTVSVSARADNRLAFMDRITNLELSSIHAEVISPRVIQNKLFAFTIYFPIKIDDIFLFESTTSPFIPLSSADFTLVENRIVLIDKFKNLNVKEFSIVVRYTHNPQFHVIDITREAAAGKAEDCEFDNPTQDKDQFPVHAVARRAHYLLDAPNLAGLSLFDNTVIPA